MIKVHPAYNYTSATLLKLAIYTYPMNYEFCGRFRGTRNGYNIEIILRSILSSSNNTHYTTLLPFQKKRQVYQEVDEPERDNGRLVLELK